MYEEFHGKNMRLSYNPICYAADSYKSVSDRYVQELWSSAEVMA
jgi:hypothetical protein